MRLDGQVSPLRPPVASASACPFPFLGENNRKRNLFGHDGVMGHFESLSKATLRVCLTLIPPFEVPGEACSLSRFQIWGLNLEFLSWRQKKWGRYLMQEYDLGNIFQHVVAGTVSDLFHKFFHASHIKYDPLETSKSQGQPSTSNESKIQNVGHMEVCYVRVWKTLGNTWKYLRTLKYQASTMKVAYTLPLKKFTFLHHCTISLSIKRKLATKLNKPIKFKRSNKPLQKGWKTWRSHNFQDADLLSSLEKQTSSFLLVVTWFNSTQTSLSTSPRQPGEGEGAVPTPCKLDWKRTKWQEKEVKRNWNKYK